ncbi:kinase-like domain-containing protein [Zychaea mexicana]|uniref:kinase-like domain-containing protein n=1 Tax=Zychaea mexicana TaxID=64656 RepID=UPI0022FDBE17|nr:kinase-like domain-containing protein [Zychaea mexicana]KAI9492176.1 kinase-like domain-containing protein [Zychaea mexicana]
MDAIRRQQLRMQIVQECYCGTEILSFEELRAQLQHRYCRNQQRLDEVKQEEADNEKVGLRIVSHYDRQKTSYHGIGSHSEEARQNVAPTPAETAQLDRHNEEASDNSNNNIRTGHHHYHQPPHGDTRTTTTTTSATAAHVASIPPASHFIRTKLAHLSPPFQSYTGFHDFTPLPLKRIQANKILHLEDGMAVRIFHKIAQGGFARVYLAETSKGNASCAIKVETPANPWEFYILRQLQTRLIDHDDRYDKGDAVTERRLWRQSIIQAYGFYLYNDGSYLVLEHANQGTLLDCFNAYRTQHLRSTMPETLALFFIIRLLQAVQTIHAVGIIHGDIKMDNVMVAFEEQSTLPQRFDDSDEEWQKQYLVLIDFGRAMDLTLLPDNVYLKADWSPQPADSLAVRQGLAFRPRAIDYYGLASIAHWLLFGKAMSIVEKQAQKEGGGWQIQERWKRYWHSELWQQLFELLLNPPADDKLSDTLIAKVTKMGQQILQQDKNLAIRVAQLIVQSSY